MLGNSQPILVVGDFHALPCQIPWLAKLISQAFAAGLKNAICSRLLVLNSSWKKQVSTTT